MSNNNRPYDPEQYDPFMAYNPLSLSFSPFLSLFHTLTLTLILSLSNRDSMSYDEPYDPEQYDSFMAYNPEIIPHHPPGMFPNRPGGFPQGPGGPFQVLLGLLLGHRSHRWILISHRWILQISKFLGMSLKNKN
jgi:hypothetical protein